VNGGPNFRNPGDAFRWSKDGEWILVAQGDSSFNATTQGDIWKIKADGTGLQNLTPDSPGNDTHPSFSRDGREIVFRSSRSGSFELYVMNSDGSNVRRLTNDAANDLFPVFSPSARQVAFMSNRDAQQPHVYDVYLLDLLDDGQPGRVRRLTRVDAQKGHMAYSYDGRWLIYSSEEGGSMTRSRSCNPSFLRDRATARCTPSTSAMDAWCA
jgi:Tol biopolymer transport system component